MTEEIFVSEAKESGILRRIVGGIIIVLAFLGLGSFAVIAAEMIDLLGIGIGMAIGLGIGVIALYLYQLPDVDCKIFKDTSRWLIECFGKMIVGASILLQLVEELEGGKWKAEITMRFGEVEKSPREEAIKLLRWSKETHDLLKPMLERYFEISGDGDKAEFPELPQHLQDYVEEVLANATE